MTQLKLEIKRLKVVIKRDITEAETYKVKNDVTASAHKKRFMSESRTQTNYSHYHCQVKERKRHAEECKTNGER